MPRKAPVSPTPPPDAPATREAAEARHAARSPLSLHFELLGCEWATTHARAGQIIPTYTFHPPCPFGKAQPDQDCRTCQHHRIQRVGAGDFSGTHRYAHHGLTVPLTEAEAEAVLMRLTADGVTPLARPAWQEAHAARAQEHAAAEARQAAARDMEQRSSHLPARAE